MSDSPAIPVAVFGSCVTRDNFNSTFNPGYKDLFECVALADHVSLVSLMAPPVPFDPDKFNGLEPRIFKNLRREFSRSFFSELLESQPEYLIMDFWPDVVFGFADLDTGHTITHNGWSTTKTDFFKEREAAWFRADSRPDEFMTRWKQAADEFMIWMQDNLSGTRVVIHSARNVRYWVDNDGETQDFGPWGTTMNRHWAAMDDYISTKYSLRVIDVLATDQTSFEGHPWNQFPVHYTFDYHQRFLSRMSRFVLLELHETFNPTR